MLAKTRSRPPTHGVRNVEEQILSLPSERSSAGWPWGFGRPSHLLIAITTFPPDASLRLPLASRSDRDSLIDVQPVELLRDSHLSASRFTKQ